MTKTCQEKDNSGLQQILVFSRRLYALKLQIQDLMKKILQKNITMMRERAIKLSALTLKG